MRRAIPTTACDSHLAPLRLRVFVYAWMIAAAPGAGIAWAQARQGAIELWERSGRWAYGPAPNTNFVAVAGGYGHSLGLKADGSVVAWRYNIYGQTDVPAPNTGFVAISAGAGHSLGLKADGSIVAWGANGSGQTDVPVPNTGFVAVAAGHGHSLGLKADGSIVAWGSNFAGQRNVPAPNSGFVAIAAGREHSLGLKADGSIVAWECAEIHCDENLYCGCSVPASAPPSPNSGFVGVAAGGAYSLGLKADGSIVAWGFDYLGQTDVPAPNMDFVAVAAGEHHGLGLKSDGSIVAWGNNWGQTSVPAPNVGFVAIAGGREHSLAIRRTTGDADADGDVDAADLAVFGDHLFGPSTEPPLTEWPLFDLDGDGDVDLRDWALLESDYVTGPDS